MTLPSQQQAPRRPSIPGDHRFLGVPVGELGWFSCILMGAASGFAAFFLGTFLAIVTFLLLNSTGHHLDYALTYKRVGLPLGLVVGIVSLLYLGSTWARRKISRR